jgi:hypothetical protein
MHCRRYFRSESAITPTNNLSAILLPRFRKLGRQKIDE